MRLDRRGVEGLPFKLLITGIIMAVILPIGYTAYSAYDEANLVTYLDTWDNVILFDCSKFLKDKGWKGGCIYQNKILGIANIFHISPF